MKSKAYYFLKAFMGGFSIALGATLYLMIENHNIGAFFFSIGLVSIYVFDFDLYTGKICYILDNKPRYIFTLLLTYIGNLVGTVVFALMLSATRIYPIIIENAVTMSEKKLHDNEFSAFIMAIFCGLLMSIAVLGFKRLDSYPAKIFMLVLPVMAFLQLGFDHSIANLFYFSFSNVWSVHAVIYSLIYAIGNLIGGNIIPLFYKTTNYLKQ